VFQGKLTYGGCYM